jgi:hypothetical protein
MNVATTNPFIIQFRSEHMIYENYVKCTVKESEMNLSYNPSLSSSGELKGFVSGSEFAPYATSIGFYNDKNELLMVAKFAKPIKISNDTDLTFLIRYDT